jgi:hypothetical protein
MILASDLFTAEVTNVFGKYNQLGHMSLEQCEKAVEYAIALPDEYSNDLTLHRQSFYWAALLKNRSTICSTLFYRGEITGI